MKYIIDINCFISRVRGGEIIKFSIKKTIISLLLLTVLSLSIGFVSAEAINGTDSYSIDDNSQLIEIDENTNLNDVLYSNGDEVLNAGITPDVKITDNINNAETKNITKGTAVTINVQATADFSYHYDSKVATLFINGKSIKTTNLIPYNYDDNDRRGSFDYTFSDDGTYDVKVVLEAYSGYSVSYDEAASNIITYVIGNGSSSGSEINSSEGINGTSPVIPTDASVKVTVWDRNCPDNTTIYANGDYVSDIEYTIVKSGDGFSDENLEVYVNGQSVGRTTPNASNRLGNLVFDEDNEWTFYIAYSATVNDKSITVLSNSLTFITRNTSGGPSNTTVEDKNKSDDSPKNSTDAGNKTDGSTNSSEHTTNDTNGIKILIRDVNHLNNSTITLYEKYNALLEYYVTVPSGDLLRSEIILYCNGESITSISNPADAAYTSVGGSIFINETGTYVFSAKYYYYEFLGNALNGEVESNTITYVVTISNSTENINGTSPSEGDINGTHSGDNNGTIPSGDDINSTASGNNTNGTTPSGSDVNGTASGNNTDVTPISDGNTTGDIESSIDSGDMIRGYNSPHDYKATFYDNNGNPLKNTEVQFVINGNDYNVLTDEYGIAKVVKSLGVGSFEVTIFNPATGHTVKRNLTIVDRITGGATLKMDYSYSAVYTVRLFADNGNPVGAGESVVISVGGIKFTGITDSEGYANVTIKNTKLIPKTYTVTSIYKDVKVSGKLIVKQILKSKNLSFKKSVKTKKFTATLKTTAGKAIKNKKITFKIKGKTYTAKTNKKGVATIKVTNLKKVGKYTVTVKYLKTSIKKTIKIKK